MLNKFNKLLFFSFKKKKQTNMTMCMYVILSNSLTVFETVYFSTPFLPLSPPFFFFTPLLLLPYKNIYLIVIYIIYNISTTILYSDINIYIHGQTLMRSLSFLYSSQVTCSADMRARGGGEEGGLMSC